MPAQTTQAASAEFVDGPADGTIAILSPGETEFPATCEDSGSTYCLTTFASRPGELFYVPSARLMRSAPGRAPDTEVSTGTLAWCKELAQDHIRMVRGSDGIAAAARETCDLYVIDGSGAFCEISDSTDLTADLIMVQWLAPDAVLGAQLAAQER